MVGSGGDGALLPQCDGESDATVYSPDAHLPEADHPGSWERRFLVEAEVWAEGMTIQNKNIGPEPIAKLLEDRFRVSASYALGMNWASRLPSLCQRSGRGKGRGWGFRKLGLNLFDSLIKRPPPPAPPPNSKFLQSHNSASQGVGSPSSKPHQQAKSQPI